MRGRLPFLYVLPLCLLAFGVIAVTPGTARANCPTYAQAVPWHAGDTGTTEPGSSWPEDLENALFLCSASLGFGPQFDAFRYLVQPAGGPFT